MGVFRFSDLQNNEKNCENITCPISGELVVLPAIIGGGNGKIYDYFIVLDFINDNPEHNISKGPGPTLSLPILKLMSGMNENERINIGHNFKFKNLSILECINKLCFNKFDEKRFEFQPYKEIILKYYGNPEKWDVSSVTRANYLFSSNKGAMDFDYDVSGWDLSNVRPYTDDEGIYQLGVYGLGYCNYKMNCDINGLSIEQYEEILNYGFRENSPMYKRIKRLKLRKEQAMLDEELSILEKDIRQIDLNENCEVKLHNTRLRARILGAEAAEKRRATQS